MTILDALVSGPSESRFGFQDWVNSFTFDGHRYGLDGTLAGVKPDVPDPSFKSMVAKVHNQRGPVAAAVFARQLVLSQVRFRWDTDGALTEDASLRLLNRPGRSHLLMTMEGHGSYAGNAIVVNVGGRLQALDPTRVSYVLGSESDPDWDDDGQVQLPYDWRTIGVVYNSGNLNTAPNPARLRTFLPGEYVHWMPEPDLANPWRGASWVVALVKDLALAGQIAESKAKFFENAMTGNLIFVSDKSKTADELKAFKAVMEQRYAGSPNMWRNMYVGGVEDIKQVGQDIDKVGFRDMEGGIETQIGMRARIPTVIFGTREGQQGSALNAGNYAQARRNWSDMWFTPAVEGLCEAFEQIVPARSGSRLAHDPSKILFLQEDEKDAAEIMKEKAAALSTLAMAGVEWDSAVEFVNTQDVRRLIGAHNGLPSVQQQQPA